MVDETNKSVRFISKLIALTQEKSLIWVQIGEEVYVTTLNGQKMRMRKILQRFKPTSSLSPVRTARVPVLDLLSENNLTVHTFSGVAGLGDLINTVKYSVSNVEEFMNDVLKI